MIKEAFLDLRRQRSLMIAIASLVLLLAAIVVADLIGGIVTIAFDLAVVAAGVTLYFTCDVVTMPPFFRPKQKPVPFRASEAEGGRLEIRDGVPFLLLKGGNRQMGCQAGALIKEQIEVVVRDYLNYIFRNPAGKKTALQKALSLEKYIPEPYLEEIRGMSETSGIPYEELLLGNTFIEDYRLFLCSTLAARGAATASGQVIMGRNLDFPDVGLLRHYGVVAVYRPENCYHHAALTYPGFVGTVTGMNERGLTCAMLLSWSGGFSSECIPSTIAFRMMLERCANVAEARDFLNANRIAGPFNLSLADASGGMLVAELAHDHFGLREPEDDVLICTNKFHTGPHAVSRPDWRTRLMKSIAQDEHGKFDVERMKRALVRVYLFLLNLQCIVLLPEERVVHLSMGKIPAAKGAFKRIDLKEFLG
jgi:predicted choloylglycine hydrolase